VQGAGYQNTLIDYGGMLFGVAVGSVCALTYQGSLMARSAIFTISKIVKISWTSSLVPHP